jgi:hypothetical protein
MGKGVCMHTYIHRTIYRGGPAGPFRPGPWLGGGGLNILLFNLKYCNEEARMWEFRLTEVLISYSCPFVDIHLHYLNDTKSNLFSIY